MKPDEIRERLFSLADNKYANFSSSLIPNAPKLIGVRLPQLRRLSRELARQDYNAFLTPAPDEYFEEIMLRGMIIGELKCSAEQRLVYMKDFIPTIANWSVCDGFCTGLKFAKENKPLVFSFIGPYLTSKKEFEARFGFVMLTFYFIDDEYYKKIFKAVDSMTCHDFYAEVAAAWCLSMVCVKYPAQTVEYLVHGKACDKIVKLTKKKIYESRQFDSEFKDQVKLITKKIEAKG